MAKSALPTDLIGDPSDGDANLDFLQDQSVADLANDPDVAAAWGEAFESDEANEPEDNAGFAPLSSRRTTQRAAGGEASPADPSSASLGVPAPSRTPASSPWYTSEHIEEAKARGLDPVYVRQYGSEAEFDRAMVAIDVATSKLRQQPAAPRQEAPAPIDEASIESTTLPDGRVNVAWMEKSGDFTDESLAAWKAVRAMQDKQIERDQELEKLKADREADRQHAQQEAANREAQREVDLFHEACDRDDAEFWGVAKDKFGIPQDITDEQQARREAAWEEAYWARERMMRTQQAKGLPVALPSFAHFLEQAKASPALRPQVEKFKQQKHKAGVRRHAAEITPTAGSRGAMPARRAPGQKTDDTQKLAADRDVSAAWDAAGVG